MNISDAIKTKKESSEEYETQDTSETTTTESNVGNDILTCLFEIRDASHLYHLQTDSHAHHTILNEFYDKWLGMVDGFAETWQGAYDNIIEGGLSISVPAMSEVGELKDWMRAMKDKVVEYYKGIEFPCLLAIMDEMLILMDTTIDLLRRK